jgi:predicted MFS family arabinose efflux permease
VLGGFIVGATFLVAFAWWERHTPGPMLDVRFFRNPRFSAASATITLAYFSLFASTFLLTQYFQFILGYSPLQSGLMLTPVALGLMIGSPVAPRLVQRVGTTRVVVPALLVVAACVACYASDTLMSSFLIGFLIRGVYGIAMGMTTAPVTESIMGSLPPGRAGVGSAVNDTTRQTGGALGVAVLGSILAARFHQQMDASALPAPLRHAARDSIGVALAVAKQLPARAAVELHAVARHAFLSGARLAFLVATLVVLAAAAVAARFLPAREAPPETVTPGDLDQEAIALEVERLPA